MTSFTYQYHTPHLIEFIPFVHLLLLLNKPIGASPGRDYVLTRMVHTITLAARGLEEPRNSEELLIESVGPVFLFCVLCEI